MSVSSFSAYRKNLLTHLAATASHEDVALVSEIFSKTHNFLATENLTTNNAAPGTESLGTIPQLITGGKVSLENLSVDVLDNFIRSCNVPEDTRASCAVEVARIISGANSSPITFVDKGRGDGSKNYMKMGQIYGSESIAMLNKHSAQAIESFGEYSDRVTSDSRLAVALTVLRSHKSLADRILPRKASEDPVVIIKTPSPEVYNLDMSQNPSATTRYIAQRQPLIELYRSPDAVNTMPQQIVPKKANDNSVPAGLIADDIIVAGQKVNLFDLTLNANTIGFQAVDWTDLVSDGGAVDSILVQVTQTPLTGSPVVETYSFPTRYLRQAQFVTQTNVQDSGDRAANIRAKWNLTAGSLMSNGLVSEIFSTFTGVNSLLEITFNANLNIKTSYTDGNGSISTSLQTALPGGVPSGPRTTFGQLSFQIVGWSPYLFFSEENMRKTTAAVRMNFKEIEFLIPVGRNFVVDYSLMGQEVGQDVTNTVSEVINIGNSIRSVTIMNNTLRAVNARLQYELANPDIDYYSSVAQDFAAGTLSLPHVYVGALDLTHALTMRESERLSDLHSYVTSRLLALIADAHNKSMYTENFEAGERARYKVVTSGPIAEVLFGILQYWNALDDKVAVAENSNYSLKLPNGTQLDIIKSNFEFFANTMIIVPIRDAKPDDVTSFGSILDRGTFVGQYTPVSNGAANKRIVANSREILFPTNPLGFVITVSGLDSVLQVLTDSAGLME